MRNQTEWRVNGLYGDEELYGLWRIISEPPELPNLSICQESRYECLRDYKVVWLKYGTAQRAYFNFVTDTLFLNTTVFPGASDTDTALPPPFCRSPFSHNRKVKRLAISREL